MTIREELRRRARRAAVGFGFGMLSGLTMMFLAFYNMDKLVHLQDPRLETWGPFVFMGGFMAAGLTMATGGGYAYLMGRGICCDSVWPVLHVGQDLAQMRCCPYCGRSLDDKLPAKGGQEKSRATGDEWEDELA
jgi:hypothetical protein